MFKVVVPVSGGKDSQACLKLALREYDKSEILGLFCDTKFEHPLTYAHIDTMRELYGVEIRTICAGSVEEKILKYRRFPGGGARHCTEELKLVPGKKFYKALAQEQGGYQVWLGMRSGESHERKTRYEGKLDMTLYPPHEVLAKFPKYLHTLGVAFRLPVIDLTKAEIFQILNGQENPLYAAGFDRVGCFPCMAGGDVHKERAFGFDETGRKHKAIMMRVAKQIDQPIFKSIGGSMRNNEDQMTLFEGCAVCAI